MVAVILLFSYNALMFQNGNSFLQTEDDIMRRVMKETQDRVRMYEENHRRWQQEQQQMQSPPPLQPTAADL